jgi:hypothetical protein
MGTETKDAFAGRLEPKKLDHLEREGWSLTLEGTQFTKMWPDGTQSEISFENVRDMSLDQLKDMMMRFPAHTAAD